MKIKKADFIIFLFPIIISILSVMFLFSGGNERIAEISVDGVVIQRINLETAENQTIDPKTGYHNIIQIKDGKIGIISADCPDKTCINTGFISRSGQACVCIPSKLIIKICGESEYDAISG